MVKTTKELLQARLAELQAEKAAILAASADKKAARDAKVRAAQAHIAEANVLTEEIKAIERPRIISVSDEISNLAKALGARAMSDKQR